METVDNLVARLRERADVIVTDRHTECDAETGAFGAHPSIRIGDGGRALHVDYTGPMAWRDYDPAHTAVPGGYEPEDPAVDELRRDLARACRREGARMHWTSQRGVVMEVSTPAALETQRLADEIRVTRVRAAERPHPAHTERLAELMERAGAERA